MRKYKIYLPLKYNDGKEIEPEKIKQIKEELIGMFGAITVSSRSSPYQGTWKYGGVEYIDDIIKIEIVTSGDKVTKKFLKDFKERLKESLRQVDILTPVPNKNSGIQKFMPFNQVSSLLGKTFFWARTIKVPYLNRDEAQHLLGELNKLLA